MPNSTLTHGAVALLACLLLTAVQAEVPAQPKDTAVVTQGAQLCRNVARPGSRIATRQCAAATDWAGFDQRVAAARLLKAYPHEGTFGYTAPPSVVMNR